VLDSKRLAPLVEGMLAAGSSGPAGEPVGELAAVIRRKRPPEPYKGKGLRYAGEFVRMKAGKAGKVGKK
jgi:large subunit ribosomal protein L6